MAVQKEKQIAVLVDTATGWGRRLVRGIIRYARERSRWHLWIEARGQDEPLHLPPGWSGDGILARVATPTLAREIETANVPAVNVSSIELAGVDLPRVTNDVVGSAEMAVEHFAVRVRPLGIRARRSTEILAIDDPDLALAVRFIRDHASDPITVADILGAVPVSRRQLERGFQRVLSRTPAAEIRRVHLERAKDLLTNTDSSIPEVAANSGFGSPEYLAQVFRREVGISPLKYRNQIRGG